MWANRSNSLWRGHLAAKLSRCPANAGVRAFAHDWHAMRGPQATRHGLGPFAGLEPGLFSARRGLLARWRTPPWTGSPWAADSQPRCA
ncbi:hypothetical protein DB30_06984 [Enhygromyxa salina]|uniref:Uncharacterized protein n=1 Tax=Enhygromyxa salina TaxID=215803 RepID=A0A0C2CXA6_9BACT|nr:hypothetical protein DB30_06984 [Enhygromyxa salina]